MQKGKHVETPSSSANSDHSSRQGNVQAGLEHLESTAMSRSPSPAPTSSTGSSFRPEARPMSAWGLLSSDKLSRLTPREPARCEDKVSEVIIQKSATHFAVLAGLPNMYFRAWQQLLPEGECGAVMSAYLEFECSRLRSRFAELEKQCDQMSLARFVSEGFSAESWLELLEQTVEGAVAACLHKASWTENHQWLDSTELSDEAWVQHDEELADEITDMMSAVSEAMTRTRTSGILSEGYASILDKVTIPMPHTRLREVRGESVKSNIPQAQERHVARQKTFERGLVLGMAQHTRPTAPSPLREERGDSPDPISIEEAGPSVAERYSFEVFGPLDDVDMILVLEMLRTAEFQDSELYL